MKKKKNFKNKNFPTKDSFYFKLCSTYINRYGAEWRSYCAIQKIYLETKSIKYNISRYFPT